MKTFDGRVPEVAHEIREAVADWSEALAEGRFAEALEMFPPDPRHPVTPDEFQEWIANYGHDRPMRDGSRWKVTTLRHRPDAAEIISDKITVEEGIPRSWDASIYLGIVHYDDVPLNGERSDL